MQQVLDKPGKLACGIIKVMKTIELYERGQLMAAVSLGENGLVATKTDDPEGIQRWLTSLAKKKNWSLTELLDNLPDYLTGMVTAAVV